MAPDRETVRALYKKLLGLYPRAFRERFGESMEQTFTDLCNERSRRAERRWFGFVLGMFVETAFGVVREQVSRIAGGSTMKPILLHPRTAAIISCILCLPIALVLPLVVLNIEPRFGPLQPLLTTDDGHISSIVPLGALLLVPVAFIISLAPLVRNARAGISITANPTILFLAAAILLFISTVLGSFIVDQYPCWTGVPNCD